MKVINIRKEKYTHYIGRPTRWGNPFVIGKDGTREDVIRKYESMLRENIYLMSAMNETFPDDAILGCYCAPLACHGDVIIKVLGEIRNKS